MAAVQFSRFPSIYLRPRYHLPISLLCYLSLHFQTMRVGSIHGLDLRVESETQREWVGWGGGRDECTEQAGSK